MKKIKNKKIVIVALTAVAIFGGAVAFGPKQSAISTAQTYTDTDYGFSFSYPENYKSRAFSDLEDTKTILVERSDTNQGAQVFISPFDEDITLTPERIKKEMPELVVLEPKSIPLGGITGVSFRSTNTLNTESYELWFIHNGNLYQVSTPIANKDLFDAIITKWQWHN